MERLTGKELAEAFGDAVGTFGYKPDEFIKGFCSQHRTTQQSIMRVIFALIEYVASDEYRHDGRNQQTHKVSKQVLAGYNKEVYNEFIAQGSNPESAKKYADNLTFKMSNLPCI